jgi:hypothetical protein
MSEPASQKLAEIAESWGIFKYDLIETLAMIVEKDDPYLISLLDKHIDELPIQAQRSVALMLKKRGENAPAA